MTLTRSRITSYNVCYTKLLRAAGPEVLLQSEDDELLTYLPLCHVAERIFSGWLPLATGATINFAESPETVLQNLRNNFV